MSTAVAGPGPTPRHLTLAEFAVDELRQRIVLGELQAGSRLEIDHLAKQLGSSRIPLREAVRQLEAEGLIINNPRRGVLVCEIRAQDIDDAYDLLEFAESLALRRTAKCITPEVIERMRFWSEEIRRLEDQPGSVEMLLAHRAFHFMTFEAIDDGPLLRHLKMLWYSCERYIVAAMREQPRVHARGHDHENFVALLASGENVSELHRAIRLHLRASRARAHSALDVALNHPGEDGDVMA